MPAGSLRNLVIYQTGAAVGMAASMGSQVRHLKLHGALANMASEDKAMARACYEAALSVAPEITIMVMAGTAQQEAAAELGCKAACEIFADRAYNDDATLVDRSLPGAVIHDPQVAAQRVAEMVKSGAIIAASGKRIPARIDTVCLHGDTPAAVALSRAIRSGTSGLRLRGSGIGAWRCFMKTAAELEALKGGSPVTVRNQVAPSE